MSEEGRRGLQVAFGPALNQGNASTGRLGLVTSLTIGGAMREAEATADTAVGSLGQARSEVGLVQEGFYRCGSGAGAGRFRSGGLVGLRQLWA